MESDISTANRHDIFDENQANKQSTFWGHIVVCARCVSQYTYTRTSKLLIETKLYI